MKSTDTPLSGHYQLIDRIGSGGFSEVWLAHDLRSQVDVVLKVYVSPEEFDDEGVKMFRKEFRLVCNLNHTNILKPFTFDMAEGCPYIVLPYCANGSAAGLIGRMTEDGLWDFAAQVAAGLAYLHRHGIIHQDIKPANVLINSDNEYMITDFGISTAIRNTIRRTTGTPEGSGTTAYMPYECMAAKPRNVIARDIWAFGATLYELATGDVPFGEYGGLTQKATGSEKPEIECPLSQEMRNLIADCLSFETWDRPSAEEILRRIDSHKNGSPVLQQPKETTDAKSATQAKSVKPGKIAAMLLSAAILAAAWWCRADIAAYFNTDKPEEAVAAPTAAVVAASAEDESAVESPSPEARKADAVQTENTDETAEKEKRKGEKMKNDGGSKKAKDIPVTQEESETPAPAPAVEAEVFTPEEISN